MSWLEVSVSKILKTASYTNTMMQLAVCVTQLLPLWRKLTTLRMRPAPRGTC